MNNTTLPSDNPLRIPVKEKSQTCEDGGAHIIISFWHLLINFEKPEKPEFWKNEKKQNKNKIKLKKKKKKKNAGDIIILHLHTKSHNHKRYISWDRVRQNLFVILGHFLPFYPSPP